MIKRIIVAGILVCLFIAIPLAVAGIQHVELGAPFMAFLRSCNRELEDFKIAIPDIPHIPLVDNGVVDVLINFVNGLVNLVNVIIMIFNGIIQVLQFVFIVIKNLINFKDVLESTASTL